MDIDEQQVNERLRDKGLSPRQIDVAKQVAKGISSQEAANILFISEKTIKFHLTSIYKTLKIQRRGQPHSSRPQGTPLQCQISGS